MAGGLTLGGLISGMSTEDIIAQIMDVERLKVTKQEMKKTALQAKQSAWREVETSLTTLRSKLDTIRFSSLFESRKATLTDDDVATVTVASGATLTVHTLAVTTLAQAHVVATNSTMSSPNAKLNDTLPGAAGTFDINGETITVTATDTLNSLRDQINNNSDIGVTADVVKVEVGGVDKYRLVLTADDKGLANQVTFSNDSGSAVALGLWDGATISNELAAATDASFELDNVTYTGRSSNVVDDILPGLTITLTEGGGASTTITVEQDAAAVSSAVKGWVDAVNSTLTMLADKTKYDSEEKTAGILQGDALARRIQTAIRGFMSNKVAGLPTDLNQMSHVGITSGKWGTDDYGKILFDSAEFEEKLLEDPEGVARVFGALRTNVGLSGTASASSTDAVGGTFNASDAINGDTDSDRFGSQGGGWQSANPPSAGSPEWLQVDFASAKDIDQIRLYIPDNDTYPAGTEGLKAYTLMYKDISDTWQTIEEVTAHSGMFKTFDFDAVEAKAVKLEITETYDATKPARVTELEIHEVNNGAAIEMYTYVKNTLTTSTGPIDIRDADYTDSIEDIDKRIERLQESLTKKEEALRRQFTRLEQALAKLQSQGNAMASQILGLQSMQSSSK
ncbi:MAG TPA: flagellar filament capping protein FliD [Symbiobacteriaceae bacterium]|nr:flagellar filament capping protein FliD [Symbiobacteriaceae bacterium]